MKTFMQRKEDVKRDCYVIDAKDQILGKIAVKAADYLRGKHKVIYTPHVDTGDYVIVINAEKVKVTGKKLDQKVYKKYSGYPSGQKEIKLKNMLEKSPETVIELAVKRMIPGGPLGNSVKTKLKVYAGDSHPHQAQKPIPLEI
jgi:large subunit ribosomal protein L13